MVCCRFSFSYNCVSHRATYNRHDTTDIQYFTLILTVLFSYPSDSKPDVMLPTLLRSLGPKLHTMPLCDLLLQHLVDQLVLLDHRQAFELWRFDVQCVHGSATAADVLHLSLNVSAASRLGAKPAPSGSRCRPPAPDLGIAVATLQP